MKSIWRGVLVVDVGEVRQGTLTSPIRSGGTWWKVTVEGRDCREVVVAVVARQRRLRALDLELLELEVEPPRVEPLPRAARS